MKVQPVAVGTRALIILALLMCMAVHLSAHASPQESNDNFVTRAVFADGRLWMLNDGGRLVYAREQTPQHAVVMPEAHVLDICRMNDELFAITREQSEAAPWILRRWDKSSWVTDATVKAGGERLAVLACSADGILLLTSTRLINLKDQQQHDVALQSEMPFGLVTSVLLTSSEVLLGINSGEWGGGLLRISRRTGAVTRVERHPPEVECAGPLSTACDPVNGIVEIPWKKGCYAVAIGLIHFEAHGRITEVCGTDVKAMFHKPVPAAWQNSPLCNDVLPDGETNCSMPFFGIASNGQSIMAVGIDGLYQLGNAQPVQFRAMPKFKAFGRYWASFDMPDYILVLTDINKRQSVSGAIPLLVPR